MCMGSPGMHVCQYQQNHVIPQTTYASSLSVFMTKHTPKQCHYNNTPDSFFFFRWTSSILHESLAMIITLNSSIFTVSNVWTHRFFFKFQCNHKSTLSIFRSMASFGMLFLHSYMHNKMWLLSYENSNSLMISVCTICIPVDNVPQSWVTDSSTSATSVQKYRCAWVPKMCLD